MCTYSMIADTWRAPTSPNYIPLPSVAPMSPITPEIAKLMLDILKKTDELDKKVGLLDCKLNAKEKAAYQGELRKIAKGKCPCKLKKKAKAKKPALLVE
jgi:hypothetical protein